MRYSVFTNFAELAARRQEWEYLLAKSDANPVFMSFDWIETWWKHFGERYDLLTHFIYQEDRLVGILPLIRRRREGFRQLTIMGVGHSDFLDFILDPDYSRTCVQFFLEHVLPGISGWDMFHCARLVSGQQTCDQLLERIDSHNVFRSETQDIDVALYIPVVSTWEEYTRSHIDSKLLREARRQRRRIQDQIGDMSIIRARTEEEVRCWLPALFAFHRNRRNNQKGDFSIFNDDLQEQFYRSVALRALSNDRLFLHALQTSDSILAISLGFVNDGKCFLLIIGFDEQYEHLSLGTQLILSILEDGFEQGYKELNLGFGGEGYKYKYTKTERHVKEIALTNNTLIGQTARFWFTGARSQLRNNAHFMDKVLPKLKTLGVLKERS